MKKVKIIFNKYNLFILVPLIAASSVVRDYLALKSLLAAAKLKRVPFKKIYEALLQNYLFAGYPSALVSLKILRELYPSQKLSIAEDMNLYHFKKRGEVNCRKVYGDKYEKLLANIKNFSPELSEWLVLEGYGKVLGRKGLSFKERELCAVALLTVLKFEEQLYSHISGAIKAGASIKDIRKLMESLKLLSGRKHSDFGLRVLRKYEKEKGMKYLLSTKKMYPKN